MKKRGFTLIEIITVLFILNTLIFLGGFTIKGMIAVREDIKFESLVYEIKDLISYAKLYSSKHNLRSSIHIDGKQNSIKMYIENPTESFLRKIAIPKDVALIGNFSNIFEKIQKIKIKDNGYISTAGTLKIKHKNGEEYKITITVGSDLVTVYEPGEK